MNPSLTARMLLAAALCGGVHTALAANDTGCPRGTTETLKVRDSIICLLLADAALARQEPLLRTWIERSAHIVANYYGRFPAPLVRLKVRGMDGTGVGGGRTSNDSDLTIQVRVGQQATAASLAADWVLVHEMVHLALPEIGSRHLWLAEGLATYVEGVARAQFGNRDIADVWAEDRRSMPLGLPRAGEGGMDQTASWGRTYWGGALYCLQAEVAIREQTGNRSGLQTALRAILNQAGNYGSDRDINEVLRIGDAATGTHVLQNLYARIKDNPERVELDALWHRLGVPENPATQSFDDHAVLAAIRIAITNPMP